MVDKDRVFSRLYDTCIEDDRKPPFPRGYTFRKDRVRNGIIITIMHMLIFVFWIYFIGLHVLIIFLFLSNSYWLWRFRLGVFSFYYVSILREISNKSSKTIIEAFVLEFNYEKNNIIYSQENLRYIKSHIMSWTRPTFIYRDKKYLNRFYIKVTLKGVYIKQKLSKKARLLLSSAEKKALVKIKCYDVEYFNDCTTVLEFQKRITDMYLVYRNEIFKMLE